MKPVDLSIIIPAYNEGEEFGPRMRQLAGDLAKHDLGMTEVILVMQTDDNSGDVAVAEKFIKNHKHFRILHLGKRAGKGGAVKAGMLEATGRYRMFMDADLATPLHHLAEIKALMDRGGRAGIAIRDLVSIHKGVLRKLITGFGNVLAQVILLPGIRDTQCGFKVFEASVAETVFKAQTIMGWGFDLEILALVRRMGYTIETFPANDWKDPKTAGLVGDSPAKAAIQVFRDLLKVRWGLLTGKYHLPEQSEEKPTSRVQEHLADAIDRWYLAGALAAGAIVRFIGISRASIWHDEGYTMMLAPQSPVQILLRTGRDVHPPLYYLCLHYWMKLFGSSELAARGMSAVLMLGTIIVGFMLAKRLFGHQVARLAAVFLALGPFLVRYGQEARMYGMAAFLAVLASYLLVRARQSNRNGFWVAYSLTIAAGLYTHYYIVFVIALHWLYMVVKQDQQRGLVNPKWWLSNVASLVLFLPWVPTAYHQFTRVQGGFWIPKPTVLTLPSTIGQFLTFTDLGVVTNWIRIIVVLGFLALCGAFIAKKKYFPGNLLVVGLTFLAPVAVLILSLKRPIYVDRYFVFAAVGFYILLAALLILMPPWDKRPWLRWATVAVLVLTFAVGIRNVYSQAVHKMAAVGSYVNAGYQPGDEIVSGELYTYFDFSYYNHTGQTAKLIAAEGVSGYGETSLLYDRSAALVVDDFSHVHPLSGRIWVVGKPGPNDDFKVPASWKLLDQFQAADSKVEHFQVN